MKSDPVKDGKTQTRNLPKRVYAWLNKRTGLNSLLHESLDEPIPGGARLAYVFGSGLIFIFISQVITGIALALYYVPSAETAHTSVAYITKQVAAGAFLRSLHYYGSSAMIIVLALHFLQTFLYGSFKGRRELLWISGALLSFLVLAMGFTGYLLPWDQKAYFATAVGTNIVGEVPLIGEWLTRLLRGGDTLGTLTLSRFYVAHLFLIPGAIFLFIGVHIALFRKAGPAGPIEEDPISPKLPAEGFYPRQVIMDMAFALLLMIGLGILAYFHPVELGPVANPADTQFLPRPEWYYLSMFEWLKFWQGGTVVFAIVVVPGILAVLFFLLPFLDRSLERRPWRRPIPLLGVLIVLVGAIFLGIKSRMDDARDPATAAQTALQEQQEKAYSQAPFEPYIESPGASAPIEVAGPAGPADPSIALGKGIFAANGCAGCHGENGTGTPAAPSLVGIGAKYPADQVTGLLREPSAKMRAGGMPAVDLSTADESALLNYLGALGTSAANVTATHSGALPHPTQAALHTTKGAGVPIVSPSATGAVALAAGQEIFQSHACSACHGPAGVGTARAPALAALVSRLSDSELAALLRNPNPQMRAGGMSPLSTTPEQEKSVIAYLRSLPAAGPSVAQKQAPSSPATAPEAAPAPASASNAAAPPAAPSNAVPLATPAAATTAGGRAVFVASGCAACHGPNAEGTPFAPSLLGVGRKFSQPQLADLLRHPAKRMRDGGMPAVNADDEHLQLLVSYLSALSSNAAAPASQQAHAAAGPSAAPSAVAQIPRAPLSPEALRGKAIFEHNGCESCHGTGGLQGTVAAPALAGTASVLTAATLENLLRHHSKRMQQGGMPLTNMHPADMSAIIAYIRSLPVSAGAR